MFPFYPNACFSDRATAQHSGARVELEVGVDDQIVALGLKKLGEHHHWFLFFPSTKPSELLFLVMTRFQKSFKPAIGYEVGAAPLAPSTMERHQASSFAPWAASISQAFLHPGLHVATACPPILPHAWFQMPQDCTLTQDTGRSPKNNTPLGWPRASCGSPHAPEIWGGSFWMMWPPKRLSPVLQGCSSSLITSTAYASCVRSKANSKLVLAVSHTNVVLTISVPSSLFPPSPWTTKLIRVIFFLFKYCRGIIILANSFLSFPTASFRCCAPL